MGKHTSWSSQTPRHSTPGSPRRGKNQPRKQRRPCCNGTHHLACRRFSAMTTEENSPMSLLGNSTDDWKRRTSPRHRITFRDIPMWRDAIAKFLPTSGWPWKRHDKERNGPNSFGSFKPSSTPSNVVASEIRGVSVKFE